MFLPNQLELQTLFSGFLFEAGLSSVSVKNYLSDLRHFLAFCASISSHDDPPTTQEVFQNLSKYLDSYLNEQKKSFTPQNTVNRRSASIRRFSTFISSKFGLTSDNQEPHLSSKNILTSNIYSQLPEEETLPTVAKILEHFKSFLVKEKKTYSTVKNYVSDLNHFFAWSANSTPFMDQDFGNLLSESQLNAYVTYLKLSHTSTSVINRRQSSIRQFTKYCFLQKFIPNNPFEYKRETPRLAPLSWFERHITPKNKDKKNGSKSRLAIWYQKYNSLPFTPYLHLALLALATTAMVIFGYNQIIKQAPSSSAALPTVPRRQLSFQGRLTDSSGTPIVTSVSVTFKLWNDLTAGSQLYTSGACSITPDPNGIFNTLIGDGVCGSEIANTVFTENRDVFLEVIVGAETLTPRQQIATVGYALNSETLQGYPASASATVNTVPIINASGNLVIAATSPTINSTSGTFTLNGQALTLTTTPSSGGNIVIQPDAIGAGQVLVLVSTTNTDSLRIENANLTSGALISGYVGNNTATGRLLSLTAGSVETDRFYVGANGQTGINTGATLANAALIVNQNGTGNLFTASASGTTKFTITNNGNITATGTLTGLTGLTVTSGTVSLPNGEINNAEISELDWTKLQNYPGACGAGQAIQQVGDTLTCIDIAASSGNLWQRTSGSLAPVYVTDSLNLGSTATTSALIHLAGTSGDNSWFNNGFLGIGLTNPAYKLDVTGDINLTGGIRANGSFGTAGQVLSTTGTISQWIDSASLGTNYWQLNAGALTPLNVTNSLNLGATATSSALVHLAGTTAENSWINTGNVGIGTTAPSEKLDVAGNLRFSGALMPNNAAGTTGQFLISAGASAPPTWTSTVPATSVPFSGITSGTNLTAAMVVGSGATLDYTGTGTINASTLIGATWVAPGAIGSGTPNSGAFTTLTSSGNTTLGTGASSVNTIGSTTTPGTLTLHGATTLDNTFTVSGNNLTTLGGDLTTTATTFNLLAGATTTLNVGPAGAVGSITLSGGSADTGCTLDGTTGALTCSGNISTTATTGTQGWWQRIAGNLSPVNLNDTVSATTSAAVALTLTQTGAFNALLVQDQAGDPTPFVIDQSGNVGIGVTNPSEVLQVVGNVRFSGALMPNNLPGSSGQFLTSGGAGAPPTWTSTIPATSVPFSGITSGTNLTAAMVVGSGATLDYTGTGTINASTLIGATWAAPGAIGSTTPNTGAFTTLSASTSITDSALSTAGVVTNTAGGLLGTLAGTTTTVLHGNATGLPTFSSVVGGDLASNITISTTGNISTTGTGTITSAGLLTASNGFTLITGALNLTATSGSLTLSGLSASSINTGANALTLTGSPVNINNSGTGNVTIGNVTGGITLHGATTLDNTFTVSGANLTTLGGNLNLTGAFMPNNLPGTTGQILTSAGAGVAPTWSSTIPATSVPFSGITSGTNLTAAMVVGSGATLDYTGTGTINASTLIGATWVAPGAIGSGTPNSGAFTTLTSSGNTTLGTGASSVNTIGSTTTPGTLTLHGATTLDNTFTVSGNNLTTLGGDLAVNGGDITSTSGTVNLFNTGVTTLNIGGDATTVSIGDATGTTTINNALAVTLATNLNGNTTIGNAITDNITFTGRVAADSDLIPIGTVGTNDLGSLALPWDNIYGTTVYQGANQVCDASGSIAGCGGLNYWQLTANSLSPVNSTYALNVGNTASTSAFFHVPGTNNQDAWFNLGTGNVGIGTTGPRNGLEVSKLDSNYISSIRIGGIVQGTTGGGLGSEMTRNQILFSSWRDVQTDSVGAKIAAINYDVSGNYLGQKTDLAFFTNPIGTTTDSSIERMRITSAGNVGIGTTNPISMLSVGASSQFQVNSTGNIILLNNVITSFPSVQGAAGSLMTNNGSGTLSWGSPTGTGIQGYWTRTGTNLYNTNQGDNVGIGTTAPSSKLSVAGAGGLINSGGYIEHIGGTDSSTDPTRYMIGFSHGNTFTDANVRAGLGMVVTAGGAGNLVFETGSGGAQVERMRINGSGNVGIGTTSPGQILHLNGTNIGLQVSTASYGGTTYASYLGSGSGAIGFLQLGNNSTNYIIGGNSVAGGKLDFIVNNTNAFPSTPNGTEAMTILANGNVGIGVTNPTAAKLVVAGDIFPSANNTYDLGTSGSAWSALTLGDGIYYGSTQYISIASRWLTGGNWNISAGNLRIGDTNAPTAALDVIGNASISGTLNTGGDAVIAGGVGKINVGTVDPPYTINGTKYATYMASMVGIKEETVGKVSTTPTDFIEGVGYRTLIDLDGQPTGSDIWLFSQTTDIQSHINDLSVLLTPEGQAKAWYEVDKANKILAIYSSTPTNISYRLTAPRFDSYKWLNTRPASETSIGHVINDPNVYSNTNSIFDNPQTSPELIAKIDGTYSLTINGNNNLEVSSFLSSIIGNLRAGAAVVANLVTDNLTVRTKLISPLADIDQLKAIDATISGTLYADNIKGQTVDVLHSQIDLLDEKYSTASAILADLQARYSTYSSLFGATSSATFTSDPLALSPLATTSAVIPSDLALNSLNVHTLIANDLMANGSIFGNSISSFDTDLFIQPTGDKPIHLLANLMTLYPDGKIIVNGDMLITGTIFSQGLDTQTATVSGSLAVGSSTIASDSARFAMLTTDGLVIASGNNPLATISGQTNSNATIGTAMIAAGTIETSILNTKVTPTTLIYITPTSDTGGRVLFVKSKTENVGFTVGITGDINTPETSFNYWLVETK